MFTSTTAQNKAHHNDLTWIKTKGRNFSINNETYISEYLNPFTGQAIRKSWRMTGQDWAVFNKAGEIVRRAHSLTYAKELA